MAADRRGYNAFHTAAMNGHLNLVHFLILLHAKQSKQNSSSATWLKTIIDTTDSKGIY
jgi:ankyrin repeat protein